MDDGDIASYWRTDLWRTDSVSSSSSDSNGVRMSDDHSLSLVGCKCLGGPSRLVMLNVANAFPS